MSDTHDDPAIELLTRRPIRARQVSEIMSGYSDDRHVRHVRRNHTMLENGEKLINDEHLDEMARIYETNVVVCSVTGRDIDGADMAAASRRLLDKRVAELHPEQEVA